MQVSVRCDDVGVSTYALSTEKMNTTIAGSRRALGVGNIAAFITYNTEERYCALQDGRSQKAVLQSTRHFQRKEHQQQARVS
jgi:hypothetical protein